MEVDGIQALAVIWTSDTMMSNRCASGVFYTDVISHVEAEEGGARVIDLPHLPPVMYPRTQWCRVHFPCGISSCLPGDTAGQERYRTITTAYYRGAMGFLLMYDITNEESFQAVQDWIYQIKFHTTSSVPVILIGHKCDMEAERVVTTEQGATLARQLGTGYTSPDILPLSVSFPSPYTVPCHMAGQAAWYWLHFS
ncbi:hypothetical protein RRG08_061334 [Elysia crispata]|uniref:Uncharacterized protein n=1 Tax=Elysia crispata TaxID=231223 RepID=A0AAE1AFR8_9GAST|nr:hypothetical protein RRG08_061334 [Elysia crispata]